MAKRLSTDIVKSRIIELYDEGMSPDLIMLAFRDTDNSINKRIEKLVMNTLKEHRKFS